MKKLSICLFALCLAAGTAMAQSDDMMITEYIEGSGNNKAVEVWNGTNDIVDMSGYAINVYFNGATTATTINLDAVEIYPDEVWILVNSAADAGLLALADQTDAGLSFNGDDSITLTYLGTVVDSFGQVGTDPGNRFQCPNGDTLDETLRRVTGLCTGNTIIDDAFACDEWDFFGTDVFDGLGFHIGDCGTVAEEETTWSSLKADYR